MKTLAFVTLFAWIALGQAETRNVSTSEELQHALDNAKPGDVITLLPDKPVFLGPFIATASGAEGSPIVITGGVAIIMSNTTGLTLQGDFIEVRDINLLLSHPEVGILISGKHNTLRTLLVSGAVKAVKITGDNNTVVDSVISASGDGVLVLGKNVNVTSNVVRGAPAINLEAESCCGVLSEDNASGDVLVKGTKFLIENVVVHGNLTVAGCDNSLRSVISSGEPDFNKDCSNEKEHVVKG